MKFSTSTVLCLLSAGAYSAVIGVRDGTAVKAVLSSIQSGIDSLTVAAKDFNGSIQPVSEESNKLIDVIASGTATIRDSTNLGIGEVFGLISPVKELHQHAQMLSDEFKGRISTIEQARSCTFTRDQLGRISDGTSALIDALVSKVPSAAQGVAMNQASKITAIIEDAKASLAEDKCVDTL
ncbi:hypothetical protein NQ176_g69 [Zarea fungicola]|uniref:Uncharacterized protein n=1 Tax=Zarea fungicola TaxID=93591 RepID=A0ACC1NZE7_9HYPO|nr:hypothetical protein NQ176_g69 [Lecanicillium fungicola]